MTELVTPEPTTVVVDDPNKPRKAIVAGILGSVGAGLAALVVAFQGDQVVSNEEWATIALAVVATAGGAFGGTFAVNNPKAVQGLGNSLRRGRSL